MEMDERITALMTEVETARLEIQTLLLNIKVFIAEAQLAAISGGR